jgi:hypothetical protein
MMMLLKSSMIFKPTRVNYSNREIARYGDFSRTTSNNEPLNNLRNIYDHVEDEERREIIELGNEPNTNEIPNITVNETTDDPLVQYIERHRVQRSETIQNQTEPEIQPNELTQEENTEQIVIVDEQEEQMREEIMKRTKEMEKGNTTQEINLTNQNSMSTREANILTRQEEREALGYIDEREALGRIDENLRGIEQYRGINTGQQQQLRDHLIEILKSGDASNVSVEQAQSAATNLNNTFFESIYNSLFTFDSLLRILLMIGLSVAAGYLANRYVNPANDNI